MSVIPRELEEAGVAELTGLLRASVGPDGKVADRLKTWPKDMRVIVRRRISVSRRPTAAPSSPIPPASVPGRASGTLGQLAYLEARHRAHARVEDCIRNAKSTGLGHLSKHYSLNPGLVLAAASVDLLLGGEFDGSRPATWPWDECAALPRRSPCR